MNGPHILKQKPIMVCTLCDHLKPHLVQSGRNPIWEYYCTHEASANVYGDRPGDPVLIGQDNETPEWCPMLKRNRNPK